MIYNKEDGSGYFLNYLNFGLDILISEETHQILKFVLHSNFPIDTTFGTYERSNFKIPLEHCDIEPNSNFREIKQMISKSLTGQEVCSEEMALENNISAKVKTLIYGFDGLLAEVYEDRVIVKVTLF